MTDFVLKLDENFTKHQFFRIFFYTTLKLCFNFVGCVGRFPRTRDWRAGPRHGNRGARDGLDSRHLRQHHRIHQPQRLSLHYRQANQSGNATFGSLMGLSHEMDRGHFFLKIFSCSNDFITTKCYEIIGAPSKFKNQPRLRSEYYWVVDPDEESKCESTKRKWPHWEKRWKFMFWRHGFFSPEVQRLLLEFELWSHSWVFRKIKNRYS